MKKPILLTFLLCYAFFAYAQWTDVSSGKIHQVQGCEAIDANTVIASGNFGKIYRSANGGMTFDSVQTVFDTDLFGEIEFVNDSVGFITGGSWFGQHHCFLLRTTDQGTTWDSITSEVGSGYFSGNICFLNEQIGFMATDEGVLFKTTDGGQNFAPLSLSGNSVLNFADIDFPDMQTGYVTSHEGNSGQSIYRIDKTTDQGQSWSPVWRDTLANITVATDRRTSSLYFLSPAEGFAAGSNGRLLHTTDGGQSWSLNVLASDTSNLTQIQFTDPLHGYIANIFAYGGAARPFFYTADGGQTWQRQNFSCFNMSMRGSAGYAVSNDLVLFATQTGGLHAATSGDNTELEVFPNPVGDRLKVRAAPSFLGSRYTITDMSGKAMNSGIMTGAEQTIDLHGLAFGTYFLTLTHPTKGQVSKKFAVIGY